jgi:hypothetical protein
LSLNTTIGIICLIALIIIFCIKLLNVLNKRKFYKTDLSLIGMFLSLIAWVGYMAAMGSSLYAVDVITTGSETITMLANDFYILQVYYPLIVFLFIINVFMGLIEVFISVGFLVKEYTGEKNE